MTVSVCDYTIKKPLSSKLTKPSPPKEAVLPPIVAICEQKSRGYV